LEDVRYLSTRLRRIAAQLPHLPRAFSLVWTAARHWTVAWIALLAAQGLLPVATVYLTRSVVDALLAAVRAHGAELELRTALVRIAAMAAVLLASELLQSAANWVRTAQSALLQDHVSGLIHQKSAAVDLAFYDWPEYYDELHRARQEAAYRPVALLENLGNLFQNGITLVAMLGVLIPFGVWLPLILLASSAPAFFVVLRYAALQHQFHLRTTADDRRSSYYEWLLTGRETAAELRLFGTGRNFQEAFQTLRAKLRRERLDLAKHQGLAQFAAGGIALALTAGSMGWMGWRAVRGMATLGDLALFYQAFQQGLRLMRSLLEGVGQIYQNSLFLGNLFQFLALEQKITQAAAPASVPAPLRQGVRFRGVGFRYPGANRFALRDLDLLIPAGRITAIVGPNGAGKSTLLNLLCRFYDPDQGAVEWDGMDLRALALDPLRSAITVLFQQPVHYNDTAAENIALGDLRAKPGRPEIEAAAAGAGAAEIVRGLPAGYDSMLGRWFANGSELSTGEWQRIALARAFLRKAPLLILDEPTSAMDPWAEADWLRRFRTLASGRTAVVITHRFTTAMIADSIYVMDEGRVMEQGTHDELLAAGSRYAEGWRAQARNTS
jgi:ATP-binding cassette, subfamily B, bacterial